MEPIVDVDNVGVVYNIGQGLSEVTALRDISVKIYPREFVIFFGPSGCGKSTLLNVVAGLEIFTSGNVTVGGRDLNTLSEKEMALYHRHEMGFVFQAYNLIPTLSVMENIALPKMFDGLSRGKWSHSARELGERFGISEQLRKLPQELSGGQQQRVGVARALINNPALILADEPTGNLDSKNARLVLDIFQDLNRREKKTILLVTHSMDYLGEADRIFYLKDGRIVKEVRNKERRAAKKLGDRKEEIREEGGKKAVYHPGLESVGVTEFALHFPEDRVVKRIERVVEKRIRDDITKKEMVRDLDKPLYKGGAELNRRAAIRIGNLVEHIIDNAAIICRAEGVSDGLHTPVIAKVRSALTEALELELTEDQNVRLDGIIVDRLANKIGPVKVKQRMDVSFDEGGMGLWRSTARRLARYLELIILVAHHKDFGGGGERALDFPRKEGEGRAVDADGKGREQRKLS